MANPGLLATTSAVTLGLLLGQVTDVPPPETPRPRSIRLTVRNATLVEAANALGRAAGVSLEIPEVLHSAAASERCSFQWAGVSFPQALRELCRKYDLVPLDTGADYRLIPAAPQLRPDAPDRIGEQQREGLTLFLSRRAYARGAAHAFNGKLKESSPVLTLDLSLNLGDRDRATILGVRNVVARDDRGNLLKQLGPSGFPQRFFPDEWCQRITLQAPPPAATRLVSLEGDLMVTESSDWRRVRVQLPERGKKAARKEGIAHVEAAAPAPIPASAAGGPGYVAHATLRLPERPNIRLDADSFGIRLLDRQGRPLPQRRASEKAKIEAGVRIHEFSGHFGPTTAGAASVEVRWREQAPPSRLFTFRMTEVPLPRHPAQAGQP